VTPRRIRDSSSGSLEQGGQRRGSHSRPAAGTPGRFLDAKGPFLRLSAAFVSILVLVYGISALRANFLFPGLLSTGCGLVVLLRATSHLKGTTLTKAQVAEFSQRWLPLFLPIGALFLGAIAANRVAEPSTAAAGRITVGLWLVSLGSFSAGVLWLERWRPRLAVVSRWLGSNWRELLLVLAILGLGLGTRLYGLAQNPFPWAYDETTVGMEGQRVMKPDAAFFDAGWLGDPNLSFYPTAAGISLGGNSILALRGTSAVLGTLTILFLYLLARELFGKGPALVASAFLTTFPYHLQFSRLGVLAVQDALMTTMTLWLVFRAIRGDRLSAYLWAGMATGLAMYANIGSRLVPVLALSALAYVCVHEKAFLKTHRWQLAVFLGASLIVAAPMVIFFLGNPQIFNSRLGQVGIFQNGWITHELGQPGRSLASILTDQLTATVLVYIASAASGGFFNSPQPYLTLAGSFFFMVGMVVAFQHLARPSYMILLAWFWSVVIAGGVLTISPPANTRLVMSIPAVALLVALGLAKFTELLGYLRVPRAWQFAVATISICVLVIQNALFYFGPYTSGRFLDDKNAEASMQAGVTLQNLGPAYHFYMIGLPSMSASFPTIPYLAPLNKLADVDAQDVANLNLAGHLPALILATPDNEIALQALAQRYPGGTWQSVSSQSRDETLYFSYILGSPQSQTTP
jgi:4-amino-4-deoxy-L-arabinose transferase-like glycosyltransferase